MNLLWKRPIPKKFKTKERQFEIVKDSATVMPNVLFVGNSYLFQVYDYVPVEDIFSNMNHWYYNHTSYSGFKRKYAKITEIDRLQTLLLSDYVVWFADGCQIYKTSYGFVEDAIFRLCITDARAKEVRDIVADSIFNVKISQLRKTNSVIDSAGLMKESKSQAFTEVKNNPEKYFVELQGDGIPTSRNERVEKIIVNKQINNDPDWRAKLESYSVINNITFEKAVSIEMENINKNKLLIRDMNLHIINKEQFDILVNQVVEEIYAKPNLMESIKGKAVKHNKTLEQAVIDDAKWMVKQRLNKYGIEYKNK